MKIGVMIAATAESGDIAEIAREAENLGYESFFIPEHPVIPIGFKTVPPGGGALPEHYGRWMDPFVGLALAAGVTRAHQAWHRDLPAARARAANYRQDHRDA